MGKVVVLASRLNMGGIEVALIGLLEYLVKKNHDVSLLVVNDQGTMLGRIPSEVKIIKIEPRFSDSMKIVLAYPVNKSGIRRKMIVLQAVFLRLFMNPFKNHYALDSISNKIESPIDECDAVFDFHGYNTTLTWFGANKINAKYRATWCHTMKMNYLSKIKRELNAYDNIFCVSEAVKSEVSKKYPEGKDRIKVLHCLTDVDRIKKKSVEYVPAFSNDDSCIIVTVGRLDHLKGMDIAIRAAKLLKDKNCDFKWYIIGGGEEEENLRSAIQSNGVKDCVFLLGEMDNPYPYMRNCDIYVQPSRSETYGLTVLEAKILRKPVIATNLEGLKEQITNRVNGLLTECNEFSLADSIEELIHNPQLRKQFTDNLAEESFDFESEYKMIDAMCGTNDTEKMTDSSS